MEDSNDFIQENKSKVSGIPVNEDPWLKLKRNTHAKQTYAPIDWWD